MKTKIRGFTLIELLIGVTIVGVLASVAIPSYRDHVIKAKRSEAQGALVTFANAMEQWRLQNGTYLGAATGGANTGSPAVFSTIVPISGGTKTYDLTINAATATTYTLRAVPVSTTPYDGYLDLRSDGTKLCEKASSCLNGASW